MKASRDVSLTIGKGVYNIKTLLGEDSLERVKSLLDHAYGTPVRGMGQEDLLVLTCLKLAYALDSVTMKMQGLLERMEEAEEPEALI